MVQRSYSNNHATCKELGLSVNNDQWYLHSTQHNICWQPSNSKKVILPKSRSAMAMLSARTWVSVPPINQWIFSPRKSFSTHQSSPNANICAINSKNRLNTSQQYLCYTQKQGFKAHLRPMEFLSYKKVSPLNNQTLTLRSVPCAPIIQLQSYWRHT